jgi:thiol-disulfide isomerase/thioredoxin
MNLVWSCAKEPQSLNRGYFRPWRKETMKPLTNIHLNRTFQPGLLYTLALVLACLMGCARDPAEEAGDGAFFAEDLRELAPREEDSVAGSPDGASSNQPGLTPGDDAPDLRTGRWLRGEPVGGFEPDKGYLIAFWATWSAPSVSTISRLNELHDQFKDQGLVVIGQNVWEHRDDTVVEFVKELGGRMSFRVALDDKSLDKQGTMAATWLEAAGQDVIPVAFLINREGRIAWIGNPMSLENKMVELFLTHPLPARLSPEEIQRMRELERTRAFWFRAIYEAVGTDNVEVDLRDGEVVVKPPHISGGNRGTTFKVVNSGSEPHELIIVRKPALPRELPIEKGRVRYWAQDLRDFRGSRRGWF